MSRSLSDQLLRVGRSTVILNFQHINRYPSFECLLPAGA